MQTLWSDDSLPAKDVCQVPKTQEWGQHWGGLKRNGERALRHSHTSTSTRTCIQKAEQTSRCASQLQMLHHRITWPSLLSEALYTTCSLCIGPIQFSGVCFFVCLLFSWLCRFCLYLSASHQANSPDLAHVHLAICKQSMIGCGLISRYWIFRRTNTLLLTKGQKHHKGLRDSVCISRDFICSVDWTKPWLEWFCLPPLLLLTEKHISSL